MVDLLNTGMLMDLNDDRRVSVSLRAQIYFRTEWMNCLIFHKIPPDTAKIAISRAIILWNKHSHRFQAICPKSYIFTFYCVFWVPARIWTSLYLKEGWCVFFFRFFVYFSCVSYHHVEIIHTEELVSYHTRPTPSSIGHRNQQYMTTNDNNPNNANVHNHTGRMMPMFAWRRGSNQTDNVCMCIITLAEYDETVSVHAYPEQVSNKNNNNKAHVDIICVWHRKWERSDYLCTKTIAEMEI